MSKIPVSVCIIAKNEEKFLEECLKRISQYGFEIIVTDTGSTDRTKEIAAKYADKVLDFEWINDFSAARNYCAKHASYPWIISLDCDEYVEKIDIKALRMLMQKVPNAVGNIRMKVLIKDVKGQIQYTTEEVTRCYRRDYYQYVGAIHEQITPFGKAEMVNGAISLDAFIAPMEVVHQGYVLSKDEMEKKQNRNLTILQAALEKDPEDAYLLFQCAQSMYILGDIENACKYYESVLSHDVSANLMYVRATIMGLAKCYMHFNQPELAISLLKKYEEECKTAKYVFLQACIFHDTKQLMKALLYYVKATTMDDKDTLGANLLNCYQNIIMLAKQMGNDGIATLYQQYYEACLTEKEKVLGTMQKSDSKIAVS